MRRNVLYFVLVPATVLAIVVVLFADQWIEAGFEYAGERAVGARVEIDDLSVSLFPIGLEWARLQVADPRDTWSNLFETGQVRFRMDAGQLLRAKFIVETVEVHTLIVGSKRRTDGKLDRPVPPVAAATDTSLTNQSAPVLDQKRVSAPMFDLARMRKDLNIDSLLNARNLETYVLIDSLTREVRAAERQWDSTLAAVERMRTNVTEIEKDVRSIDVNAIRTVPEAQKAFATAKDAYEKSSGVITAFQEQRKAVTDRFDVLSGGIRSIDDAATRDFRAVLDLARLPDVSMAGLAQLVLGKELLERMYGYLGYVDMARQKIPQYTPRPDPDRPRRSEGITVHFPEERSYPKFWVKQVVVSGASPDQRSPEYFYAEGTITDITNDQRLTGKPIVVDIKAARGPSVRASFDATFDRRQPQPHDQYDVRVTGMPVAAFSLGRSDFLPSRISDARADASIRVDVPGPMFEARTRVTFENISLVFERDPRNTVERLTRDVLTSVRGFFLNVRLWKKQTGRVDVAFETDLDDQLSSRARQVIGDEVARIRNEIRAKVDAEIARKRAMVVALYEQKRAEVMRRLADAESQIRQKLAVVEQKKKELEQRVEQEKKRAEDELKKKAGDALKGILRKN